MNNFLRDGRGMSINHRILPYILPIIIFCVLFSVPDLLWTSALAQSQHRDKGPLVSPAYGQEANGLNKIKPAILGHKVPDEFWIKEHLFYVNGDTIRQSLAQYKGKLLVLDFYMTGCVMCMEHQKEISHFKKENPDQLAVIMVNSKKTTENYAHIDRLYKSGYFERNGIKEFVTIIEDTYLERLFPYQSFPSYFWINQSDILQTHTFRNLLDRNYKPPFL